HAAQRAAGSGLQQPRAARDTQDIACHHHRASWINEKCRRLLKRYIFRDRNRLPGWHDYLFSPVAGGAVEYRDALAHDALGEPAAAGFLDSSDSFKSRGRRQRRRLAILAANVEQVRGIDRTGQHPHAHLPRSRPRREHVAELQYLGWIAAVLKDDRFHGRHLLELSSSYRGIGGEWRVERGARCRDPAIISRHL